MSLINDALKRANQAQRKAPVAGPLGVPLQATAPTRRRAFAPVIVTIAALVLAIAVGGGLIALGLRMFRPIPPPDTAQPAEPAKQVASVPSPQAPPTKPANATSPAIQPSPVAITPPETKPAQTQPKPNPPPVSPPAVTKTDAQPAPLKTGGKETETPATVPAPAVTLTPAPTPQSPRPAETITTATTPVVSVPTPASTPAPLPPPRKVEFPEIKLTGIFYNPSKPSALLSGRKLNVGGSIFGAKVTAIDRDSVTIEFEGEKKVLYLQ